MKTSKTRGVPVATQCNQVQPSKNPFKSSQIQRDVLWRKINFQIIQLHRGRCVIHQAGQGRSSSSYRPIIGRSDDAGGWGGGGKGGGGRKRLGLPPITTCWAIRCIVDDGTRREECVSHGVISSIGGLERVFMAIFPSIFPLIGYDVFLESYRNCLFCFGREKWARCRAVLPSFRVESEPEHVPKCLSHGTCWSGLFLWFVS